MVTVKIAAKELGWLKMSDFCPRCLWLMQKHSLPEETVYASPPARVFRQFEEFVQRSIRKVMQQTGELPSWLTNAFRTPLPSVPKIHEVHIQRTWLVKVGDAELTGRADILCQLEDGTWLIADFKLSQPSTKFVPFYETQLNAYAFLARRGQNLKVNHLALIYFEFDERTVAMPSIGGIMAQMKCTVQPVAVWRDEEVEALVKKMADLLSLDQPPEPKPNCHKCREDLMHWAQMLVDWLKVESQ